MMNNHVLPRMACSCAILIVALAHCGCQSMQGLSGWATAWRSKPAPTNPNDRETVTYMGFNKKKPPAAPDPDVLREKMELAGRESREVAFDKYLRQGNQELRENRLEEAKRDYTKALEIHPDHPDCHHRLAVIADKQEMFGVADDHYEAALKQRPRDPNLLSDIGYSYSLRGDDRRAESTLKEALGVSPSHTGAMFNLGAVYAKQGRYEETLAMFRRGVPEAQAQQNVAKLFPQHPAMGTGTNPDTSIVQNNPSNSARPSAAELGRMTQDELKAEMNRQKYEGIERRRQQQLAEIPNRQEWMSENQRPPQNPSQNDPRSNQPIVIGPGGSQNPHAMNPHELPTVTPGGVPGNQGYASNGPGPQNGYGPQNNYGNGQPAPNGSNTPNGPNGPNGNGFAVEQPGSQPNMNVWNGAVRDQRIQPAGGTPPQDQFANASSNQQFNVPPATMYYGPPTNRQIPGVNLQAGLPQGGSDQSDNLAAAQLGMNVGGLFPVAHADGNPGGNGQGYNGQQPPTMETRFGAEFPSPPQYQNPAAQPGRGSFAPGDARQGNSLNSWGTSFPQPSRAPSRFADFSEGDQLAPASPTADWSQNRVSQAGGSSYGQQDSQRFANDPVERLPDNSHANWAEKPNLNGAAPYNGSWPPANGSTGNAAPSNSIPMWNGNGGQGNSPSQPASSQNQASYPEQWQYSRPR